MKEIKRKAFCNTFDGAGIIPVKRKLALRAVNIALAFFYGAFFFMAALLLFRAILHKDKPLTVFDLTLYKVATASMEPEYMVDSLILSRKVALEEIEPGDVIIFKSDALGGQPACHRVINVESGGVYTKGDNNKIGDNQLITAETLIGKSVFHTNIPADYAARVRTFPGFMLFAALPLTGFALLLAAKGCLKRLKKL